MHIRELEVKHLHKVANWLYHMNEQDHHYAAWLASHPNEIFEQIWTLTQFDDPLAYIAWDNEEIIGFLGLLPFFEQKLCRLLGPFATKDQHEVMESLWDKASLTVQLHFNMVKVACFEANHQLVSFSERHDFQLYNKERTLAIHQSQFKASHLPSSSIVEIQKEDYATLDQLHPAAAYYTTEEIINLSRDPAHNLWGYQVSGTIVGYLYFETIIPENEGEICFIHVEEDNQGLGIGTTLIEHALQYAFNIHKLDIVTISVRSQNQQAEDLYQQFGFTEVNTIYAYQKEIKPPHAQNINH